MRPSANTGVLVESSNCISNYPDTASSNHCWAVWLGGLLHMHYVVENNPYRAGLTVGWRERGLVLELFREATTLVRSPAINTLTDFWGATNASVWRDWLHHEAGREQPRSSTTLAVSHERGRSVVTRQSAPRFSLGNSKHVDATGRTAEHTSKGRVPYYRSGVMKS